VTENGSQVFPAPAGSEVSEVPLAEWDGDGIKVTACSTGDYEFITRAKKHYTGRYTRPGEVEIENFTGTIKFEPGYQASIDPVEITSLKPLTDYDNPDIRYFAGNAIYTINFSVKGDFAGSTETVRLNMGNFNAVADVTLNGKSLGRIWKPGTELDVTGLLKTDNQLVVNVANVYRNRFIGDFTEYGKVESIFTSSPITQFLDRDKPLKPAGLMGPLKLIMVPEVMLR
jgi:hypothetical protein